MEVRERARTHPRSHPLMPTPAPRIVYNDAYVKLILKNSSGLLFPNWPALRVGLWTNNRPLDRTLTAPSFIQPAFGGYGVLPISWNLAGPSQDISGLWGMDTAPMIWTVSSIGGPIIVYGWLVGFLVGAGPEAFFAKFDTPKLLAAPGQQVAVQFRSRLSSAFTGPNT